MSNKRVSEGNGCVKRVKKKEWKEMARGEGKSRAKKWAFAPFFLKVFKLFFIRLQKKWTKKTKILLLWNFFLLMNGKFFLQ